MSALRFNCQKQRIAITCDLAKEGKSADVFDKPQKEHTQPFLSRVMVHRRMHPFILLALLLLTACSDPPPDYQTLGQGSVVMAFGDSVTHGTGARAGEDFPTRLAQETGWQVINAGVPGDTANKARERIGGLLQEHEPELVIVELGGNDFLRRQPADQVKEHLREIIAAVRLSGAIPVLVAVPEFSVFGAAVGSLSDSPIYEELAGEERILLIDDVFSEVLSEEHLRADRIHPNAQGYRQLADGIAKALTEAGLTL